MWCSGGEDGDCSLGPNDVHRKRTVNIIRRSVSSAVNTTLLFTILLDIHLVSKIVVPCVIMYCVRRESRPQYPGMVNLR